MQGGKSIDMITAQKCLKVTLSATLLFLFINEVYLETESVSNEDYPDHKTIKAAMEKHRIVPDLHKSFTSHIVQINFKNGKSARMGNELSKEDTKEPPHITYRYEDDAYYTIIMSDLDAPSPAVPNFREWQHWLMVNIPRDNITAGETLSEYIGPAEETPSEYIGPGSQNFTGKHRYVITAYRQPGGFQRLKFDEDHLDNKSDYGRIMFSTNIFATNYDYGDPWAVNFWYTSHDKKYGTGDTPT